MCMIYTALYHTCGLKTVALLTWISHLSHTFYEPWKIFLCHYNMVNILQTQKRHPIAHQWRIGMECLLGAQSLSQGPDSIKRCNLTSKGNPIVEIRRSYDRLISTMGFPIPVRRHLYIESGPWFVFYLHHCIVIFNIVFYWTLLLCHQPLSP